MIPRITRQPLLRKPIVSPVQRPQLQKKPNVVEIAADWTEVHSILEGLKTTRDAIATSHSEDNARREQEHQDRLDRFDSILRGLETQIQHALLVQKGAPGSPGKDAVVDHTEIARQVVKLIPLPRNGVDAVIDHKKLAQEVVKLIPMPKDGNDGVAPTLEQILEHLKENFKLDDFPQVKNEMASYRSQLAGKKYGTDTFVRGGGDTLKAGSGQTLQRNTDGTVTLLVPTSGLTPILISGTIDDSNVTFTAPSQPTLLNINGSFYQKTGGNITWTYVAGTITLSSPVGVNGSIFGI